MDWELRTAAVGSFRQDDVEFPATWSQNDARVYKFQISLPGSDTTGSGLNTGSHSFTWEAQNT